MELGWSTAIQAVIIAVSTLIVRSGSKRDREDLKRSTSTPEDVALVRKDLADLRAEFTIFRDAYFRSNPILIDHRSPNQTNLKRT